MEKKRVRRLYVANYLITPDRIVKNGAVLCENGSIIGVGGESGFSADSELEIFRLDNAYITPGFIDTHIHGAGGFDCSSCLTSPRDIASMSRLLGERGVTGFLPTVVADHPDKMIKNLQELVKLISCDLPGADAVGINLEGPFLNPKRSGSQPREVLSKIDTGFARELIAACGGKMKIMTLAPELRDSATLIELLVENNIIASMGHSIADEKETLRAIDAGASHCTHLYNGMEPLHQRDIGLAAIALSDARVTVELIIDGRHVHPRMVDLACRCKPAKNLIGISDCTMASGMPDGDYRIGPSEIRVISGFSQSFEGRLAGTTTMLDSGWHSLMSCGHLSETKAAEAVTINPALHFGLDDRGVLLPGKRADLAIFELGTNQALMTVRRGEIIYRREVNRG